MYRYRPKIDPEIPYFKTFFKHIFEQILRPLWGLTWKTEICRPEELRPGCFSIRHLKRIRDSKLSKQLFPLSKLSCETILSDKEVCDFTVKHFSNVSVL